LFALRKDVGLCLPGEPIEIRFEFENEISQLVSEYKKGIIYFELIPIDKSGNPLAYSNYYSLEFELEVTEQLEVTPVAFAEDYLVNILEQ
jgi:hypothetical protein